MPLDVISQGAAQRAQTTAASATLLARPAKTVVIAGDSITENNSTITTGGTPAYTTARRSDGYYTHAAMLSGHRLRLLKNAGIAGNTSTMLRARFATDVLAFNPGYVILLIGTNDIRATAGYEISTVQDNLAWFYDQCHAGGIHLIQMTIPPCGESAETSQKKADRELINRWLKDRGRVLPGFTVVDIYPSLAVPSTGIYDTGMAADQIHPAAIGAAVIGQQLAEVINQLVPPIDVLPGSNMDAQQLITNAMGTGSSTDFLGHTGVSTSWAAYVVSSGTFTCSKVTSADRLRREWQRIVNTAGGHRYQRESTDTTKWATGDLLVGAIEFRAPVAWTSANELSLKLTGYQGATAAAQAADMSRAGYAFPAAYQPAAGLLVTPPMPVPAGMTKIELGATFEGVGEIQWGRASVVKVAA